MISEGFDHEPWNGGDIGEIRLRLGELPIGGAEILDRTALRALKDEIADSAQSLLNNSDASPVRFVEARRTAPEAFPRGDS